MSSPIKKKAFFFEIGGGVKDLSFNLKSYFQEEQVQRPQGRGAWYRQGTARVPGAEAQWQGEEGGQVEREGQQAQEGPC